MPVVLPNVPKVNLPRVTYPEYDLYWSSLDAHMVTGTDNVKNRIEELCSIPNPIVALDIETTGTDEQRWNITCVTAAWDTSDGAVSVLLNPVREPEHARLLRRIVDHAGFIVLHNAIFDTAPLFAHQFINFSHIDKMWDTLILARMIRTSDQAGRSLEDLARLYQLSSDDGVKMSVVFKIKFSTQDEGYLNYDLFSPTYRTGAMSDTIVTLRLFRAVYDDVLDYLSNRARTSSAVLTADQAANLIYRMQRVNQIVLHRTAWGINIDREFAERWERTNAKAVEEASAKLIAAGIEPGRGDHLIAELSQLGALPEDWERTDKGALKADKAAMERLETLAEEGSSNKEMQRGAELAKAHLLVTGTRKVQNYLDKVTEQAKPTGRCHPEVGVLKASATGRMSVSSPEIQQFPDSARGILCSDGQDWMSVDWSSIEPVIMANSAGDTDFLYPFENGGDLYDLIVKTANIARKPAKTLVLAKMYGQGAASLSKRLGISFETLVELLPEILDKKWGLMGLFPDESIQYYAQRAQAVGISGYDEVGSTVTEENIRIASEYIKRFPDAGTALLRTAPTSAIDELNVEVARSYQNKLVEAMPVTTSFMNAISAHANSTGHVTTLAGRVLSTSVNIRDDYGRLVRKNKPHKGVNYFCVSPDTPILTADLRHVPASSVRAGDELVGFDEYAIENNGPGTGKRYFRVATVGHSEVVTKNTVRIHSSDGRVTTCSGDHRWLVRVPDARPRLQWVEAKDLNETHQLMYLGMWESNNSRTAGYLAGLYDGEGSMQSRAGGSTNTGLIFSQNKGTVMSSFCAAMDEVGLTYTYIPRSPNSTSSCDGVRISGVARIMKTVGTLRPERFIARAKELYDGAELHTSRMMEALPTVVKVEDAGVQELMSIGTSTKTLVANGYLSHNCQGSAADVMYDTILRCDEAGLTDNIHLWVHDELIIDSEVTEQVNQIMMTPPDFVTSKSPRTDPFTFRTDYNSLGKHWAYV